jgi:hypothetical protein
VGLQLDCFFGSLHLAPTILMADQKNIEHYFPSSNNSPAFLHRNDEDMAFRGFASYPWISELFDFAFVWRR